MNIKIGSIIKKEASDQNLSQKQLGDLIKDIQQNVGNDYKKSSLPVDRILLYSRALNHNFLQYYYEEEPYKTFREEEHKIFQDQIDDLKKQLDSLNKTLAAQEITISTQKEHIALQQQMVEKVSIAIDAIKEIEK